MEVKALNAGQARQAIGTFLETRPEAANGHQQIEMPEPSEVELKSAAPTTVPFTVDGKEFQIDPTKFKSEEALIAAVTTRLTTDLSQEVEGIDR